MEGTVHTVLAVALLATYAAAAGEVSLPRWYGCSCKAGNNRDCVCPSTAPPGGLDPKHTPQFILFTHDDAITINTTNAFRAILDGQQSMNGCKAAATMFTYPFRGTDCSLLKQLYTDGYEIADHGLSHLKMNNFTKGQVAAEVVGARAQTSSTCGIPEADIVGFRQPYLQSRPTVRQVLHENGFLYDSTILEHLEDSVSDGVAARVWPYSMLDGIPQNCDRYSPFQMCNEEERYHGLFEVPVWDMLPADDRKGERVFDILKSAFDASYNGNRAPFPIFIHTYWFTPESVADMQRFADYAMAKPHTYFVTMRQLLSWMQNPIRRLPHPTLLVLTAESLAKSCQQH